MRKEQGRTGISWSHHTGTTVSDRNAVLHGGVCLTRIAADTRFYFLHFKLSFIHRASLSREKEMRRLSMIPGVEFSLLLLDSHNRQQQSRNPDVEKIIQFILCPLLNIVQSDNETAASRISTRCSYAYPDSRTRTEIQTRGCGGDLCIILRLFLCIAHVAVSRPPCYQQLMTSTTTGFNSSDSSAKAQLDCQSHSATGNGAV